MKAVKQLTIGVLLLGIVVLVWCMGKNTGWSMSAFMEDLGIYIFSFFPCAVLWALTQKFYRQRDNRASQLAISVAAIVVTIMASLAYYELAYGSKSSTAPLAYLFVPMYALFFSGVIYWVVKWIVQLVFTKRID